MFRKRKTHQPPELIPMVLTCKAPLVTSEIVNVVMERWVYYSDETTYNDHEFTVKGYVTADSLQGLGTFMAQLGGQVIGSVIE